MHRIFLLEEQTIGKIAAGEVVDRPAAVVKELLENAIDAGSSHVVVEVGDGGRAYLRVTDDGCGISEEDVEIAFAKHATSKIRQIEDLATLHTLGFRGEALPSIAAVSRVALSTRHESEDYGTFLALEAGLVKERRRITRVRGTSIEVKSLFYNLPGRIGTLKSKATELRHIVEVCIHYAVIYPELKLELIHEQTPILNTLGSGNMLDAIVMTYGRGIAHELIELRAPAAADDAFTCAGCGDALTIHGYISKPAVSYATKQHLYTYVNRRFVKSELLERAIKRGYGSLLPKHTYPFAVLALDLDPRELDVNIHPQKHELRFYHADDVIHAVARAVATTLRQADLIPEAGHRVEPPEAPAGALFGAPRNKNAAVTVQTALRAEQEAEPAVAGREVEGGLHIRTAPLYQILDSYIVAQSDEDDVILIDQHAAAERINFERLLAQFGGRIEKQALLRPYIPELSPHQLYLLREHEPELRSMGFELERLGEAGYVIRAIPVVFHGMLREDELVEVLMRLIEERGKKEERLKVLFSTAACKASIKAGEKQSYESMRELVERLKGAKLPYTCPHGRPTMIRLSKQELEKRFKRR
jgi:DNA mismatch repair protein MutL